MNNQHKCKEQRVQISPNDRVCGNHEPLWPPTKGITGSLQWGIYAIYWYIGELGKPVAD